MNAAAVLRKRLSQCRFLRDTRGVSGVEFALVAPVLTVMMVGVIDIGGMVSTKLDLNASISTAAAYAQMNAANVSSTGGASLASTLSLIVAHARGPSWADADVVVNNGPGSSVAAGNRSPRGTASQADFCYCPLKSGTTVTWGVNRSCNAACPAGGGGIAGKFVSLTATRQFTPIFFRSLAAQMSSTALVQTN
ncbi:MAG: pilus assembly protein [Hyphomicrobiales bacterium]|nr:pilus assembly protein [Hyphomicrobiales bacterium]